MLVSLIPLFDKEMRVRAYSLFSQEANYLLNPEKQGTERHAIAAKSNSLEVIQAIGIDTLSPGTDVFIPIGKISIFSNQLPEANIQRDRIVLLIDGDLPASDDYIKRLAELKKLNYKLAIRDLPLEKYESNAQVLKLMDYVVLDSKQIDVTKLKIYFEKLYPWIKLCVGNLDSQEKFDLLKKDPIFNLFEGEFYRLPVTAGDNEIAPLKANYIQLLNVVNDDDFELTEAADVIGRDTSLALSFLEMVNRMALGGEINSIRHAAAILGQKELKKWINAVVTKELCSDKPSELMRISLLRAKFAELLAPKFEMAVSSQELFLMGLFSVIDLILNCPMAEALEKVKVPKVVYDALVDKKGAFAPVMNFIIQYENAKWQEVSRLMIVDEIELDDVYDAYITAARWYRDLLHA